MQIKLKKATLFISLTYDCVTLCLKDNIYKKNKHLKGAFLDFNLNSKKYFLLNSEEQSTHIDEDEIYVIIAP